MNEIRHGDDQDFLLQREREFPLVHVSSVCFFNPNICSYKYLHIFISICVTRFTQPEISMQARYRSKDQ